MGDSREKVLNDLGSRVKKKKTYSPSSLKKEEDFLVMNIPDGRARLYFEDDELTRIEIHRENVLGRRDEWTGF